MAREEADAVVATTHVIDVKRYGSIRATNEGCIVAFCEKGQQGSGDINAGIYLFKRRFFHALIPGECYSLENQLKSALPGKHIFSYAGEGNFIDIGTPEDYEKVQRLSMHG